MAEMLDFQFLVFCFFSAVMLSAALGVALSRNTVHSALFLVAAFIAAAGVWLLLHAEFLALVLVLVYVGAVMVLFLFVLMMFDIKIASGGRRPLWVSGGGLVAFMLALTLAAGLSATLSEGWPAGAPAPTGDNTRALGAVLYTEYAYPFELAAAVLLVAIVAAIMLTSRTRKDSKYISPGEQVLAKKEGRLRIVRMRAEGAAEHSGVSNDTGVADNAAAIKED